MIEFHPVSSTDQPRARPTWHWLSFAVYALVGLLVAKVLGGFFAYGADRSSHPFHVAAAAAAVGAEPYPPHFLYHFLLNILTGFSGDLKWLRAAATLLMTAAVLAKLALSMRFISRRLSEHGDALGSFFAILLVPVLCFLGPIINWWRFPSVYLGQLTPNVWHNSTIVVAMPLCLVVWMTLERSDGRDLKASALGSLFLAASILIKPNFALAFLPFLFLLVVLRERPLRELLVYTIPAAAALLWLFLRAYGAGQGSGVGLHPMAVWARYSEHPAWSLLLSLAFPLSVVLCFGTRIENKKSLLGAWMLVVISIAQFALFAESGPRFWHGNFFWGTVPSLYILCVVSLCELLLHRRLEGGMDRSRLAFCSFTLLLHLAGGLLFFAHCWMGWRPGMA